MEACEHNFGKSVKGWCTCENCGKKLREKEVEKMLENANVVEETQEEALKVVIVQPSISEEPELVMPKKPEKEVIVSTLSSGKTTTAPVVAITCTECGAERIIKVQDKFQVTKCIACQKKSLNAKRYQNRKANLTKKKEEAKAAEAANPTPAQPE